jgi:hypothetical protein
MSGVQGLRGSLVMVQEMIDDSLNDRITHPYSKCENLGRRMWSLHSQFRTRAVLRYLVDADVDAFFLDLNREASTYVTFLSAYYAGLDVPESRVNASTSLPLICSLATANFPLAAEIDRLMPREFGEEDGEASFAYTTMLRRLATGAEAEAVMEATRDLETADADVGRYGASIGMAKALVEADEKAFNAALAAHLASLEKLPEEELEELDPGDEFVAVDALAFIQLAKRRGIRIRLRHRMIPTELQDAKPLMPTDGYPAWPG